jgi:hypothetical protein
MVKCNVSYKTPVSSLKFKNIFPLNWLP